jgi:GTP cyclohydrolase IB
MIDVQSQILEKGRIIDKVGVKHLSYPIIEKDKLLGSQPTVASINMFVQLPARFRGTHMSRFLEIINHVARERITPARIRTILLRMKEVLAAKAAHIEFFFPYFIDRTAPVSKSKGLMEYDCGLYGSHTESGEFKLVLEVSAMVLNLCPCSKELSKGKSAHNQRSRVTVKIQSGPLIWIEDLIDIIETCASSPIYTVLKRSDEKYVMDHAHENPRFVEDIVREIASRIEQIEGVSWFSVESENMESIHNHNVYAYIEKQPLEASTS